MKKTNFVHSRISKTILILFILVLPLFYSCDEDNDSAGNQNIVEIGGLFSLTGNWSTLGKASRAAMRIAIEDVNEFFENNEENVIFSDVITDTMLEPEIALDQLQDLSDTGIRYVIGPMSSSEVEFIRNYADRNEIFVLSQSSTAGSLSIPGDNIFRFAPDDMLEGKAIVALMQNENVQNVVPVWREDAGNTGLAESVRSIFTSEGGTVSRGTSYVPGTEDFTRTVEQLEQQVMDAIEKSGNDSVAVYLAGFDEVVDLFAVAQNSNVLSSVNWYGSDGVVFSEALLLNSGGSSEFARSVFYPNPLFGLDPSLENRWGPVADEIKERSGVEPDAFALSVYDAVWVIALAYFDIATPDNIDSFKASFVSEAESYLGITGSTELNEAGDRKIANFDFWGIREEDDEFIWKKLGMYDAATGDITGFSTN